MCRLITICLICLGLRYIFLRMLNNVGVKLQVSNEIILTDGNCIPYLSTLCFSLQLKVCEMYKRRAFGYVLAGNSKTLTDSHVCNKLEKKTKIYCNKRSSSQGLAKSRSFCKRLRPRIV